MSVAVENAAPAGATGSTTSAPTGSTRTVSRTMPCGATGDVAGETVADIVVLEARAEARGRRDQPQPPHHFRKLEAAIVPEVVGIAEADAMRQQIAHRDLARDVGIGELHSGLVLRH